jgi:hypothetical protein
MDHISIDGERVFEISNYNTERLKKFLNTIRERD